MDKARSYTLFLLMLFFLLFMDHFIANTTLCWVPVTLNSMSHSLGTRYYFFAIRTLNVFYWFFVCFSIQKFFFSSKHILVCIGLSTLLLNFLRIHFLKFAGLISSSPDTSTFLLSLWKFLRLIKILTDLAKNVCSLWSIMTELNWISLRLQILDSFK